MNLLMKLSIFWLDIFHTQFFISIIFFCLQTYGQSPIIAATTRSYFVIGFEEHQNLILMNLETGLISKIQTNFPYCKMRVQASDMMLAACLDRDRVNKNGFLRQSCVPKKQDQATHPPTYLPWWFKYLRQPVYIVD